MSSLKLNKKTVDTLEISTYQGFENAYKLFSKKMYSVCYSKINDKEICRDIIQNIFKSVWERKATIKINGSVEHYLMKAAKFKIIDYYKLKSTQQNRFMLEIQDQTISDNTTDNDVSFNELQEKINTSLDKLPKQCKKVFLLSRNDGVSNKEIASNLFISERAVAYHIAKAISFLKNELVEYQ